LIAAHRAKRVDERLLVDELPESLRAAARERVLDVDRPARPDYVPRRVSAVDAFPARVLRPFLLEPCCLEIVVHRASPISCVMANPPSASEARTMEPWSAEPAPRVPRAQIAAARRGRRPQPAARRCTVRRGSLGRTGGRGWGEPRPCLRRSSFHCAPLVTIRR